MYRRLRADHGQLGSYSGPEVGIWDIAIDALQARFRPINLSILWPYSSTVVCVRAPLTKQRVKTDYDGTI